MLGTVATETREHPIKYTIVLLIDYGIEGRKLHGIETCLKGLR